jgi:hypothetical protein
VSPQSELNQCPDEVSGVNGVRRLGYRKATGIPLQLGRSIQGRRRGSNTIDKGQNNLDDPDSQRRLISTDFRR